VGRVVQTVRDEVAYDVFVLIDFSRAQRTQIPISD
jgi:hypothetical protein